MTASILVTVANWHSFVFFQPLFSFRTGFQGDLMYYIQKNGHLKKLFKMHT